MESFEQSAAATLKIIESACEEIPKLQPSQAQPADFAGLHSKINGMIAALSACEIASSTLDFQVALSAVESMDSSPPGNTSSVVKAVDDRYKRAQAAASAAQQELAAELDRLDPSSSDTAQAHVPEPAAQ